MIPGRDPAFKTHPDIAATRLAVSHAVVRRAFGPHHKVILQFRTGIQVCRFDTHQAEYVVWIAPRAGDPLSDYPQLMSQESEDPWLAPGDVASLLGVSLTMVGALISNGTLRRGEFRSDSRVRQSQVLELLRSGAFPGARDHADDAPPAEMVAPPEGPWPVTILAARYQGTYEGAPWVAFHESPGDVHLAHCGDTACATFFDSYRKPIGRGQSPKHAYDDLVRQLTPGR